MKWNLFFLLMTLAIIVFQVQGTVVVPPKLEALERAFYVADERELKPELLPPMAQMRKLCFDDRQGYCLFRQYRCHSGYVFKEEFNNCSNIRTLKCCYKPLSR